MRAMTDMVQGNDGASGGGGGELGAGNEEGFEVEGADVGDESVWVE